MRKAAFTPIGALLIAGSAAQVATASEHHARGGQDHHRWDRSYNQAPAYAAPQTREGYNYGKPPANESRSCDIKWCYAD
jgi:hypothetical protein